MTELWKTFCAMSEDEVAAVQAEELRRMKSGEMSRQEAEERAEAWRRCSEHNQKEAEGLTSLLKLGRAAGCPSGTPVIPWLMERGLIVKSHDGNYRKTAKAAPHQVK